MEKQMEKKKKKKKAQRWIKPRHTPIKWILQMTFGQYCKLRYRIKITPLGEKHERQYLVLYNHQTAYDQFFVGLAFKKPLYYIASEDIFSMGFLSKLIKFLVEPIPIKKQATDVRSMLNCMKVVKEGGSIALAPEGNRTYSGKTEYINPAIIMLAKRMGLPIAIMRIEGGYGVAPRWGDKIRRGKMRSYVARVIEPEEYNSLDDCEFASLIEKELYVDETLYGGEYHGKNLAEYLERAIYYCPKCNALSTFESHGDEMECKKCGMKVQYLPTKELRGLNFELPYRFVADWYAAQSDFVNSLRLDDFGKEPIYCENGSLAEVIVYKNKKALIEEAKIRLFADRLEASGNGESFVFPLAEIRAITVCGKNKLNLYFGDKLYQITGDKRFNALKYVNLTFRYKNIIKEEKGEGYDKFLGL